MTGLGSLVDGHFYTPAEIAEAIGAKPFTIKVLCRTNPEFCTRLERNKIVLTKNHAEAIFNHLTTPPVQDPKAKGYDPFA